MRWLVIIILAAAFLSPGVAHARLGETEKEIQARYGEPLTVLSARTSDAGKTKCYVAKDYLIAVTYLYGRSAREILTKADSSNISAKEIQAVLAANSAGAFWNPQQLTGPKELTTGVEQWRTIDRRPRVAFYDSQTRALFITTQRFIELTKASARAQLARRNDGRPLLGPGTSPQLSGGAFDKSTVTTLHSELSPAKGK